MAIRVAKKYLSGLVTLILSLGIVVPPTYFSNIPLTKALTYDVSNTSDSGAGSFRQAIIDANLNAGTDTITFSASGTIAVSTTMEAITSNITIDGTTAPDWTAGPDITLQGDLSLDCLVYGTGGAGLVKGINIHGCRKNIQIQGGADGITIGGTAGNENLNITGATTGISLEGGNNVNVYNSLIGNLSGNGTGIDIVDGTTINIGGTVAGQANIINQNTGAGIRVGSSTGITIAGNYIGVGGAEEAKPNLIGINVIGANISALTIGGATASSRNYISANTQFGVSLNTGAANSATIKNNFIGISSTGFAIGNNGGGIQINTGNNNISLNTISGNNITGIAVSGAGAVSNTIDSNKIGTDSTGNNQVSNIGEGISINTNASNTTISNNIISGNTANGINILSDATGTTYVYGNKIGLAENLSAMPNILNGIRASAKIIVGDVNDNAKQNLIGSNNQHGIRITGIPASDSIIANNLIGTLADSTPRGNLRNGITIDSGASGVLIGGDTGNIQEISNNGWSGITMDGEATDENKIYKNNLQNNGLLPIEILNGAQANLVLSPTSLVVDTSGASGVSNIIGTVSLFSGTGSSAKWMGDAVVSGAGTWDIGVQLVNGDNYWLSARGPMRSTATTATGTVALDIVAPNSPTFTSSTGTINNPEYTLTGSKDRNSSVFNNSSQIVSINTATGWSSGTSLVEGVNTFVIDSRDYTGNISGTGEFSVTLDTIAPLKPTIYYDPAYRGPTVVITGSGEVNSQILVNAAYITTADSGGSFIMTLPIFVGVNVLNVRSRDLAGNTSDFTQAIIAPPGGTSSAPGGSGLPAFIPKPPLPPKGKSMSGEFEPIKNPIGMPGSIPAGPPPTQTSTQNPPLTPNIPGVPNFPTNPGNIGIPIVPNIPNQTNIQSKNPQTIPVKSTTNNVKPQAPISIKAPVPINPTPQSGIQEVKPIDNPDLINENKTINRIEKLNEEIKKEQALAGFIPKIDPTFSTPILESTFMGEKGEDEIPLWWKDQNFGSNGIEIDAKKDTDEDGLPDIQEFIYGTDPKSNDSDKDGVADTVEIENGSNPDSYDTDGDGIADEKEKPEELAVFNPKVIDKKLEEKYIEKNNVVINKEAGETLGTLDSDSDGLSDQQELQIGSDPQNGDSDSDGLTDGNEVLLYDSNPAKASKVNPVSIGNIKKGQTNAVGKQFIVGGTDTPNADVTLYIIDENGVEKEIGKTETDANGLYSLNTEELGAGKYTITAVTSKDNKTLSISSPGELNVGETSVKTPEIAVKVDGNEVTIDGITENKDSSIVVTWRSLVLTNTIVADQNFKLTAPAGLEPGEHTATVYSVSNIDNSQSAPVQVKFTLSTTGFASGKTEGISPLITIGGSSLVLLSLIALAIFRRKKNPETIINK